MTSSRSDQLVVISRWATRLRRRSESKRGRALLFAGALVALTVLLVRTILKLHSAQLLTSELPILLVAWSFAGLCLSGLISLELYLLIHLRVDYIENKPRLRDCLVITTYGSAANLLPIPGALVVRSAWLYRFGLKSAEIASLGVASFVASVTTAALLVASFELSLITFVAVTVITTILLRSRRRSSEDLVKGPSNDGLLSKSVQAFVVCAPIRLLFAALSTLRIVSIANYLRDSIHFDVGAILNLAGSMSLVLNVIPGGVGVREAFYLAARQTFSRDLDVLSLASLERTSDLFVIFFSVIILRSFRLAPNS